MILDDLERGRRWYATPGVVNLVAMPATACQSVVEARKAETEGRPAEAAEYFQEAFNSVTPVLKDSILACWTRAAASAGLVRVLPDDHAAKALRSEALSQFSALPSDYLGAVDLADHAALLEADSPERQRLLLQTTAGSQPPVWAVHELLKGASRDARRQLMWSVVRQAPLVADHHVSLAELEDSKESASSELTIAAALFLGSNDYKSAQAYAEKAYKLNPANRAAALVLADVLRLQGDADQSIEILDRLQPSAEPASVFDWSVIRARAWALEAAGRRRHALDAIEHVLRDDTDVRAADYVFAARLHTALGERDEARADFDKALALEPDDVPTVYASVVDRLRRQRIDKAVADVEAALWRCPQEPHFVVLRGYLEARKDGLDAPDVYIAHAIALGIHEWEAWFLLAFLREDQGDRRGAVEALAYALEHGGAEEPDLLLRYGELLEDLQEHNRAVAALRRAARIMPDSVAVYEKLTAALLGANRPKAAIQVLDRALKKLDGDPILLAWRGRCHHRARNLDMAERDLRGATARADLDWPAVELFWVLSEMYGGSSAVDWALDRLPSEKVAALGMELWWSDDLEGALALADAALGRCTTHDARNCGQFQLIHGLASWQLGGRDIEESLRKATELLPDDARTHAFLGSYLASTHGTREADEAEAEVTRARELDPGSEMVAKAAVSALWDARGDERALRELDDAIFYIGEAPDLLVLRAELLLTVDAKKALELITTMRAMGSSDARLDRVEAEALLKAERYNEAVTALRHLLQADPGNVEIRALFARALNANGASREALTVVRKIRPQDENADTFALRGEIRYSLGDIRCLGDFAKALEEDPNLISARAALIEAASEFRRQDLAKKHLEELLDDPSLVDEPEVVRLAWVVGESDVALQRAERSLSVHPSEPMLTLKAGILIEGGHYDEAIAAARQAVRLDPTSAQARYSLSEGLRAAGSPSDALAVLGEEDSGLVVRQRVACLFELGRSAEAAVLVKAALRGKEEPSDEGLWVTLGQALITGGLLQDLADLLVPQLEAKPSPAILRLAGSLLNAMGCYDLAITTLELARTRDRHLDVDVELAWAYSNVSPPRPAGVLAAARRGLVRDPSNLDLQVANADSLLQLGRGRGAVRLYRKVLTQLSSPTLGPRDTNSLAGWCHYRLGNYDLALDHLVRAVSMSGPEDPASRFDLGLVLLVSGRGARARREYEKAVRTVNELGDRLRGLAFLEVALTDIREAMAAEMSERQATRDLERRLETEVTLARESLTTVQRFVARMKAITTAAS